jgi:hypothetical protein
MVNNSDYVALGTVFVLWAAKRVDLSRMFARFNVFLPSRVGFGIDQGKDVYIVTSEELASQHAILDAIEMASQHAILDAIEMASQHAILDAIEMGYNACGLSLPPRQIDRGRLLESLATLRAVEESMLDIPALIHDPTQSCPKVMGLK